MLLLTNKKWSRKHRFTNSVQTWYKFLLKSFFFHFKTLHFFKCLKKRFLIWTLRTSLQNKSAYYEKQHFFLEIHKKFHYKKLLQFCHFCLRLNVTKYVCFSAWSLTGFAQSTFWQGQVDWRYRLSMWTVHAD